MGCGDWGDCGGSDGGDEGCGVAGGPDGSSN